MFQHCLKVTKIDVSSFNTSKVTNMARMFWDCSSLTELDLSSFNTQKVTDMNTMFQNCLRIIKLDIRSFNTSKVTNMCDLFHGMQSLEYLDISSFKTSNVTDMQGMFKNCYSLKELDLSHFNTSKVTLMGGMFWGCHSLENLDLSSFKTSKVESMRYMFANCCFQKLDLSSFNATNADKAYMFSLSEISIITLGPKFKKIPKKADLSNGSYGWSMGAPNTERISGDEEYAVITNSGTNTYYKIAHFENFNMEMKGAESPQYQTKLEVHLQFGDTWGPDGHRIEGNYIPYTMKYTWYRDKNVIPNATDRSYVCTKEDIGKVISFTVTDADGIYKGEARISTKSPVRKAERFAPSGLQGYDCSEMGANESAGWTGSSERKCSHFGYIKVWADAYRKSVR